jgi:hypothetical protein
MTFKKLMKANIGQFTMKTTLHFYENTIEYVGPIYHIISCLFKHINIMLIKIEYEIPFMISYLFLLKMNDDLCRVRPKG